MQFFRKQPHKAEKEKITDIYMCSQNKKEVTENTTGSQSKQLEDSSGRSQLPEQVIEHCQKDNKKNPDTQQEHRQNKWYLKR